MTSYSNDSHGQAELFSQPMQKPLVLRIQGIIPGKKNNKMLVTKDFRGRPLRKPMLITKPEYQKALEKITESLRCQSLSAYQIESGATSMASSLRSWILSRLPADDSWTHVCHLTIRAELCQPGEEGATVTIRRL